MMRTILAAALILFAGALAARALSVIDSKHDLSAGSATSGPKANENRISCLFCHAVHRPAQIAPLWNRPDSVVEFTFYSSNYLNNYLGLKAPTMSDLRASKTKLCLSCHDGVTALGSLFSVAPNSLGVTGTMREPAVVGADLSNDHPVLYPVKPGAGPPSQPGTDPEIRLPAEGDRVKVYGPENRVECVSCHDPHDNAYGNFLVKSNAESAICVSCHQKRNYNTSAHAVSNALFSAPTGERTTVGEYSCRNCHLVHGASAAQAYILRGDEEKTCFSCHGAPSLVGAKDVKTQYAKAARHPTEERTGVHLNPEIDASNLGTPKRHAECWDCHNPHQARTGTHASPGNAIGSVLLGGWGVEPDYGSSGAWQPAISFVRRGFDDTTASKEYQLCFKCHSYYAFGSVPPANATDLSVEFNPNNRSAHPVLAAAADRGGPALPRSLTAAQLSAPWNDGAKVGHQTMACSDCHGSDVPGDPKGPHGSASPFMLAGPRGFWPKNRSGELWTLADLRNGTNNWRGDLFCVNCHPLRGGGGWGTEVHEEHAEESVDGKPVRCVACHIVNPHGAKRGRLIGYEGDPAPYDYAGSGPYDRLVLKGFKKAPGPNGYNASNCYSSATGCHEHRNNAGGYDP